MTRPNNQPEREPESFEERIDILAGELELAILNLCVNSRDAMSNGGTITITVENAPEQTADGWVEWVRVSVADRGCGMPPEVLRRIFEPFFTTKSGPDASGQGGTGLGLPVCRDIVEAHQGRLRAESRPGQGTAFTLLLPATTAATKQGAA